MNGAEQDFYREVASLIRQNREESALLRLQSWLREKPDDEAGLSLKGSALLRTGQLEEALAAFQSAVEYHPKSFAAHGDLGFALLRAGTTEQAIAAFRSAVKLNREFYQGWCYLSRLLFEDGRIADAREAFRRCVDSDPFTAESAGIQAAMSGSRFAEAERLCRALLTRQSGYPRAAYTLAQLASQVGAFEEAGAILADAIRLYPCDISLRSALVVALEESGRYAPAVEEAKNIVAINPDAAASWLVLGRVHGHCGSYDEALRCYDRATDLAGQCPVESGNTQLLRGHVLKIVGRYDDSIEAYQSSIRKLPGNGAGWWGLADMKVYRFSDDDIVAMSRIANDPAARPEQRTQAAFALGKASEDNAEYDKAFTWYRLGNELRTGVKFDPAVQREGIQQIMRSFDRDTLRVQAEPLPRGAIPIFIVGLPRSGSTLIEQILASHSQIEGTMELATLPNVVRRISIDGGRKKLGYPASMGGFTAAELAGYGQTYLDDTSMYRTGKPLFIDKLPTNFDKIGLIHKILPQAIVIDARRHPIACGLSCYKQHFAGGHFFSYSLENIGHYYNAYLRLMDYWDTLLPGKVLCIRYEKLVEDTDVIVRSLLAHCGLPFEESCLRFFENRRPVRTASSEQVRQPIYNKSVAHWKRFESHLAPLIDTLGEHTLARWRDT